VNKGGQNRVQGIPGGGSIKKKAIRPRFGPRKGRTGVKTEGKGNSRGVEFRKYVEKTLAPKKITTLRKEEPQRNLGLPRLLNALPAAKEKERRCPHRGFKGERW